MLGTARLGEEARRVVIAEEGDEPLGMQAERILTKDFGQAGHRGRAAWGR